MTLNEKLEHFYCAVIESATQQGEEIVSAQEKSLKKLYEERKQAALKKAEHTYRVESEKMRREKNRQLSSKAIEIRRKLGDKVEEIIECIFQDVEKKLKEFMQTSSYEDYLVDKIKKAKSFAQEAEIIIYINPSDEHRKSILEERSGAKLTISDRDFFGGIRAVIPSRSILIDHSFLTKLAEEKETFKLS